MTELLIWVIIAVVLLLAAAGLRDAWRIRRGNQRRDDMKHIVGARRWWGQR